MPEPRPTHHRTVDELRAYAVSDQFKADLEEAQRLVREGDTEGMAAFLSRDVEKRAQEAADRLRKRKTLSIEVTPGDAEMIVAWAEKALTTNWGNEQLRGAILRFRQAFNDAARADR